MNALFLTAREMATVRVLADMIIPRDAVSGAATDAGVAEYIDGLMARAEGATRARLRLGLAWIDARSRAQFGEHFVACREAERHMLITSIAWPIEPGDDRRTGVAFFAWFRHLTATGYWTSRMGYADLGFFTGEDVQTEE